MPIANSMTPTAPTIEKPGTPKNVARPSHPAEKAMSTKPIIEIKYGLFIFLILFSFPA